MPTAANTHAKERKTRRKYAKLLTVLEGFAKLNAQIEIRERQYKILAPFVQEVIFHADALRAVCDLECARSVDNYYPRLQNYIDALHDAHRRYQALAPNVTERSSALMGEIQRVVFIPAQRGREKTMSVLNAMDLENLYHYKAYASTYRGANKAMLSLAKSSDIMRIVSSFAGTTDRMIALGRAQPKMSPAIMNLKNKASDIRAQIKALEDQRKSLVCTATLREDWSLDVRCAP